MNININLTDITLEGNYGIFYMSGDYAPNPYIINPNLIQYSGVFNGSTQTIIFNMSGFFGSQMWIMLQNENNFIIKNFYIHYKEYYDECSDNCCVFNGGTFVFVENDVDCNFEVDLEVEPLIDCSFDVEIDAQQVIDCRFLIDTDSTPTINCAFGVVITSSREIPG